MMTRARAGLFMLMSIFTVACTAPSQAAETHLLVDNGTAKAAIVIDPEPARMAKLAAQELQTYIEKISGSRLPIVNAPTTSHAVHIYVGKSAGTQRLGVNDEGLRYGAYHMLSRGSDIVLLGRDRDHTPKEPYSSDLGPRETYRMTAELLKQWDELTGREWSFPYLSNYRNFNREFGIWNQDEAGSLNAVYALLRDLGVRWYLPGELGEIVPTMKTITVPKLDRTVHPDFAFRYPYQMVRRFSQASRDELLWQLRMGFNLPADLLGEDWGGSLVHGLKFVSTGRRRDELVKKHPDWFALYGGHRDPKAHCLSSQGLFDEVVRYVRFMFDHYDAKIVSVMPADGYVNLCQCEKCEGKATADRGRRGQLSDYVWDFVTRVANEVYKTHPDHMVSCFAYGAYLLPPLKIETLPPNVVVGICQTRCTFIDPAQKQRYVDTYRHGWQEKLPDGHKHQMFIWDYYLHANHGNGYPAYFPRIVAQDLRDLSDNCLGEFIEVARNTAEETVAGLAIQHLNLYTNARFWWDAQQDIDALLEEYYALYFGPARYEMKSFIEYAEVNYPNMKDDADVLGRALDLFTKARDKVEPGSIYSRRIELIADYMAPLWPLHQQLLQGGGLKRDDNPQAWGKFFKSIDIQLDGKHDPDAYQRTYYLVDIVTGERPTAGSTTAVYAAWDDSATTLYMRIVCAEQNMKDLNTTTTRDGDTNIFMGDLIELHIETQNHAYYQLVINPAGELVDIDRHDGQLNYEWSSGVETAVEHTDTYWAIELRIPVIDITERDLDPNHNGIAGYRPTYQSPWYINVCRQRIHNREAQLTALSPTGKKKFHNREKLGRFYVGGKRPGVLDALRRRTQEANEREASDSE